MQCYAAGQCNRICNFPLVTKVCLNKTNCIGPLLVDSLLSWAKFETQARYTFYNSVNNAGEAHLWDLQMKTWDQGETPRLGTNISIRFEFDSIRFELEVQHT